MPKAAHETNRSGSQVRFDRRSIRKKLPESRLDHWTDVIGTMMVMLLMYELREVMSIR